MKKSYLQKFLGIAVALALTTQFAICADNTPPDKATPGTAAATDTKTQQNNPSGPADQTTNHPKEGTKKHKKEKTKAPGTTGTNQSGDKATKTPQKDAPPSTATP